jgi:MoxR-like ATPase
MAARRTRATARPRATRDQLKWRPLGCHPSVWADTTTPHGRLILTVLGGAGRARTAPDRCAHYTGVRAERSTPGFFTLKDRGLVVVSSCSHRGIVNAIKQAQEVTLSIRKELNMSELTEAHQLSDRINQKIEVISAGVDEQAEFIRNCIRGLLSQNHMIVDYAAGARIEPILRAMSLHFSLYFRAYQFTPDLMPSDLVGQSILTDWSGRRGFQFKPGPIFSNVFFASEINRASPRLQSALIHVMRDRIVHSQDHQIPQLIPFFLVASRTAMEDEGTYPLPAVQLEEFGISQSVSSDFGYNFRERDVEHGKAPMSKTAIKQAIEDTRKISLSKEAEDYIQEVARRSTFEGGLEIVKSLASPGVSGIGLRAARQLAQANAFLRRHDTASIEDLRSVLRLTLTHRLSLNFAARAEGESAETVLTKILG